MAINQLNKYVWLVETIHRARKRGGITLKEIQSRWKDSDLSEGTETLVHEIVGRISTERTANILCLVNFARFKGCLLLDARHKVGGEGNQHDKAIDEYQQTDDEAEHFASPGFA